MTWEYQLPQRYEQSLDFRQSLQRWQAIMDGSDQRIHKRRPIGYQICLTRPKGQLTISTRTDNISAGGVHVTLSAEASLQVGEKLQVQMLAAYQIGAGAMVNRISAPAEVVRTETLLDEDRDRLGVAVKFDQPQPLPS